MASGGGYAFGPFRLDVRAKQLLQDGRKLSLSERQFDVLHALVSQAGDVLPKDRLVQTVWRGVAVTDNSLAQVISQLRRLLDERDEHRYIETAARRGYRFAAPVARVDEPHSDAELDALLAPHRALVDGRAALETLERTEIARARTTFENLLTGQSREATVHLGLANACVLQFESTRAEAAPDTGALQLAATHARQACRLRPDLAEAWATLGFVLERTGDRVNALAALRHAVLLEPDNWRHQLRLSFGSWGEERLQAARRTLAKMPGCSWAHWLAASVYVAREALREAEHELEMGLADVPSDPVTVTRFSFVALHWLAGLLSLARGDDDEAIAAFARELSLEPRGHLYARECAANTWYAIGACRLRQGDEHAASAAFTQAIARVPSHAMAHAGLALLSPERAIDAPATPPMPMNVALARAVSLVAAGDAAGAARLVETSLTSAPPGDAGWLVPIEPLLGVQQARALWGPVIGVLRARAS